MSHQDTAIRETFEETGILLAKPQEDGGSMPSEEVLDAARKSIHAGRLLFSDFMKENGLVISTQLHPFTQWITPKTVPR